MRALLLALLTAALPVAAAEKWNLLFLTTDDMSCDSVGAWGCKLADTTPHLDRLAARALRFNHAFVQVGNCMPSRNVMGSGRYPHNNRVEGFYQIKDPDYPVLADLMKAGGWFTGIRGKVPHATPYSPYPGWDAVLDTLPDGQRAHIKNPASYHACVQDGIARAKADQKPFFLNINISDPHKPFYNEKGRGDPHVPSRVFSANEVPVPGFLPDDPEVRAELALYYSSVRRADDCVGQVLRALEEAGELERTVILFLSDHGMPLPFAKTQLYYHSTRTPMMVVWPGVTRPGAVDDEHLVSAVDLLPTLLDVFGLPHPDGLDGRSFAPVLRGEKQDGRDYQKSSATDTLSPQPLNTTRISRAYPAARAPQLGCAHQNATCAAGRCSTMGAFAGSASLRSNAPFIVRLRRVEDFAAVHELFWLALLIATFYFCS